MDEDEPFQGWTAMEAVNACFGASEADAIEELLSALRKGRLVGFARKHALGAALEYLSAAAWKVVRFISLSDSMAEEIRTGVCYYDVRVFPMLKAPNVVDLLDGMSLRLAWRRYIVGDPQLRFLGVTALAVDPNVAFLLNSGMHDDYRYEWPLGVKSDDAEELFYEPGSEFFIDPEPPAKTPEVEALYDVVEDRFTSLMVLLVDRKLEGHGDPVRVGDGSLILSSIWGDPAYAFQVRDGEVLRREDVDDPDDRQLYYYMPRWRAVALYRPSNRAPYFLPFVPDVVSNGRQALEGRDTISTTTPSETACLKWLIEEMRASPYEKRQPKPAYLAEAMQKWPEKLSKRAFERCWKKGLKETNALWDLPGAPRRVQP
jgi:hypothetical protein